MLGMGVTAQPQPTTNPNSVGIGISKSGLRREGPLAPATLLLIAMAGGYAGVRLYHNSKNNTKE